MIGIYYIATATYKVFIEGFLESLKKFRVGQEKKVILLVDEFQDIKECEFEIEQHIVSDAPWPVVTLLKMYYIYKYKGDYEEVYYFNANARIENDIPSCGDKMLVTRHYCMTEQIDGHYFLNVEDDNPKSLSYIGYYNYNYVQAGFFGGKAEVVYRMCDDISKWVENDLKRFIIPKWHDETYLNKWHVMNEHLCKEIFVWKFVSLNSHENFIPKKIINN